MGYIDRFIDLRHTVSRESSCLMNLSIVGRARANKNQMGRSVPNETRSARMSQQGKDVRLRRTQKLLRDALVELIDERGFDAITIGELTERAMVSRAAFYRNYQDKYALVEQ